MADASRQYLLHEDEDLMSLVNEGDAQALAALYRMMGEKQDAEDLVQEAFIKVWRSAGGYRVGRGSVRTWIRSVVRNRGKYQFRSRASRAGSPESGKVRSEKSRDGSGDDTVQTVGVHARQRGL